MTRERLATYKLLLLLAAAVLLLDQATKLWIEANLPYGTFFPPDRIEVIPGLFNLVHVGNTGAAWSMFTGYSWPLATVGVLAIASLFFLRKTLELEVRINQVAFGFILGGIVGNLIDRIRLGHVVDFLDFHIADSHFPSFNVADSGITVGVAIYIFVSFFQSKPRVKPSQDA